MTSFALYKQSWHPVDKDGFIVYGSKRISVQNRTENCSNSFRHEPEYVCPCCPSEENHYIAPENRAIVSSYELKELQYDTVIRDRDSAIAVMNSGTGEIRKFPTAIRFLHKLCDLKLPYTMTLTLPKQENNNFLLFDGKYCVETIQDMIECKIRLKEIQTRIEEFLKRNLLTLSWDKDNETILLHYRDLGSVDYSLLPMVDFVVQTENKEYYLHHRGKWQLAEGNMHYVTGSVPAAFQPDPITRKRCHIRATTIAFIPALNRPNGS